MLSTWNQSVLAPFGCLMLVWNLCLSPVLLGERWNASRVLGAGLMIGGALHSLHYSVVFVREGPLEGPVPKQSENAETPAETLERLEELVFSERTLFYMIGFFCVLCVLTGRLFARTLRGLRTPKKRLEAGFVYAVMSGLLTGNMWFIKLFVTAVSAASRPPGAQQDTIPPNGAGGAAATTKEDGTTFSDALGQSAKNEGTYPSIFSLGALTLLQNPFSNAGALPLLIVLVTGSSLCAILGFVGLNCALAEAEALFVVPVQLGAVILTNAISGVWVLQEFDPLMHNAWRLCGYAGSCGIVMAGLVVCAWGELQAARAALYAVRAG